MVETPLTPRPTVYGARLQRDINLQSTKKKARWDSGAYTTPTPPTEDGQGGPDNTWELRYIV
jgi:hypothetical protein